MLCVYVLDIPSWQMYKKKTLLYFLNFNFLGVLYSLYFSRVKASVHQSWWLH